MKFNSLLLQKKDNNETRKIYYLKSRDLKLGIEIHFALTPSDCPYTDHFCKST